MMTVPGDDSSTRQQLPSGIIVPIYDARPIMGVWTRAQQMRFWDLWPSRYERVPLEESRIRCEEMGLYVCLCHGVPEANVRGDYALIVSPWCRVHDIVHLVPLW